jgi:hypothetical protein
MFENSVLRRIFGAEEDEETGERRKLHNEELCNLYSFPNIITQIKSRMRWAGTWQAWKRKVYKVFVGKPERKRPLRGPRRRWMGSAWIIRRLAGWQCIHLGREQGLVMGSCERGDEPSGS